MLGVTKVDDYVDLYTWGIGWGPMTDELSLAYTEAFERAAHLRLRHRLPGVGTHPARWR